MNKDLGAAARSLRVAALSAFFYKMFLFQPMAEMVGVFPRPAYGNNCQYPALNGSDLNMDVSIA